jgi:hypothetical protein
VLHLQPQALWPANCLYQSGVKRWFKIVFLLGIVTIFLTPCDPEGDLTLGTELAIVLKREVGSFRLVRAAQPMLQQARRHSLLVTSLQRHFKETSSIIDLTCARLC